MTNYISEENDAYTKVMEWARIQKDAINEKNTTSEGPKQSNSGSTCNNLAASCITSCASGSETQWRAH